MAGRKTKLTDESQDKICLFIKAGAYIETAAKAAGISKQTFYNWMEKGNSGRFPRYVEFMDAIEKALVHAELVDIGRIDKAAASGVWQASAWKLERKFPERWQKRGLQKMELSGPDGNPIQIQPAVNHELVVEEAKKMLKAAEDAGEEYE